VVQEPIIVSGDEFVVNDDNIGVVMTGVNGLPVLCQMTLVAVEATLVTGST
jgi:hypothetical protein